MPEVSIIIRSKNDITYIRQTLEMIQKQNYRDYEIVHVDSGSTDGTVETVHEFEPQVSYQILPEDYVPGKVLNDAIKKCTGRIIVFNNSDCIPQTTDWLENLISPLENKKVAASFGRQIPRSDAQPLVIKDYDRAFGNGEISSQWFHFFSLATSAARKEILTEYPFDPRLKYSEDIDWSYRMKKRGYRLVYVKDSIVEHSHNYTPQEIRRRFYGEGMAEGWIYRNEPFNRSYLGMVFRPAIAEIARDIPYLIKKGAIGALADSIRYRFLQRHYVWKGNRDYRNNPFSEKADF